MKITSHNETFEWRLRLVEWRYAQAALLGTALIEASIFNSSTFIVILQQNRALTGLETNLRVYNIP